jgi:hypothetical protein
MLVRSATGVPGPAFQAAREQARPWPGGQREVSLCLTTAARKRREPYEYDEGGLADIAGALWVGAR